MKKLILNPKNKKGIIAELIGENGIRIQKRRSDNFPINIFVKGLDYTVVANCTLTGDPVLIECIDGKIQLEDLLIEERQDDGKEKDNNEGKDGKDNGAGANADPKDGNPKDGAEAGAIGAGEGGAAGGADDNTGAGADAGAGES